MYAWLDLNIQIELGRSFNQQTVRRQGRERNERIKMQNKQMKAVLSQLEKI